MKNTILNINPFISLNFCTFYKLGIYILTGNNYSFIFTHYTTINHYVTFSIQFTFTNTTMNFNITSCFNTKTIFHITLNNDCTEK